MVFALNSPLWTATTIAGPSSGWLSKCERKNFNTLAVGIAFDPDMARAVGGGWRTREYYS